MKKDPIIYNIAIGDELLIGQTINTNSGWIGNRLKYQGYNLSQVLTVADEKEAILEALEYSQKADLVLLTGGLGPTKDDITKKTLCHYFDTELQIHQDILDKIETLFDGLGKPILDVHKDQAKLPKDCIVLPNSKGTASGMWLEKNGTIYISMPGVPHEMKAIMTEQVFPRLKNIFDRTEVYYKTIMTQGIGESDLAQRIEKWEEELTENNITLSFLPSPGMVRLRINSPDIKFKRLVDKKVKEITQLLPQYVYGVDEDSLENIIGTILSDKNLSISTAESCTGGYIGHLLTSISGSSKYYMGSVIAYDNNVKINQLGVQIESIIKYGAVSQEVVEEMAMGVKNILNTDISIATSGIAGPTGGTKEKKVGTFWIGIAYKERVYSKKIILHYDRLKNIRVTTLTSFNLLRNIILYNKP